MQIHGIFRNQIRLVVVGPILNILLYRFSHSNIDYTLRHSHPSHTHSKFYNTSPSFIIRNWELGSRSKNLIEQTLKAFKNIPFDFSHTHIEIYHVYPDFPFLILSSALHTTHCPFNPISNDCHPSPLPPHAHSHPPHPLFTTSINWCSYIQEWTWLTLKITSLFGLEPTSGATPCRNKKPKNLFSPVLALFYFKIFKWWFIKFTLIKTNSYQQCILYHQSFYFSL